MAENYFRVDPAVATLLSRAVDDATMRAAEPWLDDLGGQAAMELDELAAVADRHTPQLQQWTRTGERVDRLVQHPAVDRLHEVAFEEHGFAAMSHRPGVRGWSGVVPHPVKYALCYEFVQAEFGLFCPISMTDSAARLLRHHGDGEHAEYLEALTSTDAATRGTGAMFMTERQGGSDVGQTLAEATRRDGGWRLSGDKWFCSNPTADVVLTLARRPAGPAGTAGLGLFLVPRRRPDGSLNGIRINRLKDKLGARSFASAEVTLENSHALPLGDLERGFATMMEMVNSSRLSNAVRSAALMRRAVTEAVQHTRERVAFGRPLFDAPLMRQTLLPLLVTAEASLALDMMAAVALQRADDGDPASRVHARVLTPLAKLVVTKRARQVAGEAMEVRGGNGYIEDWPEARLLRDAHLGSIWEGSSNIVALDVLRAARTEHALDAVRGFGQERLGDALATVDPVIDALRETAGARLDDAVARVQDAVDRSDEAAATEVATGLADALASCELAGAAADQAAGGQGYRSALVAALFLTADAGLHSLPASRPEPTGTGVECLEPLALGGKVEAEAPATVLRRSNR